ncbi:MAG: hypothetical protein Q4D80_06285 [Pseudomonadota bacterium]|nr:hypothetical protein [Pseudomonadota bacterium]
MVNILSRRERILNKIKTWLKITAIGVAANYTTQTAAQITADKDPSVDKEENVLIIDAPENHLDHDVQELQDSELPLETSFKNLKKLPYGFFNDKAEYVLDINKWRKDSVINIKRAYKQQIYHYDLTTVMQEREGQKGDVVNLNSSHTRMFIFQSTPSPLGKDFVRYLYCSPNEDLHNFAAKYVSNTAQNREILDKVRKALYDENGELKVGKEAVAERRAVMKEMSKLSVSGISATPKSRVYSPKFIADFRRLAKTNHADLFAAEKDFSIGFYPLYNARRSVLVNKANSLAKNKKLRDASCVSIGESGLYLSSSIAYGCNSDKVLAENKVLTSVKKCNRCDYITLDAVRHMALAGFSGAETLYNGFRQKIQENEEKAAEEMQKLTTVDMSQKTDAIKNYREKMVEPIKITDKKKTLPQTINLKNLRQKTND